MVSNSFEVIKCNSSLCMYFIVNIFFAKYSFVWTQTVLFFLPNIFTPVVGVVVGDMITDPDCSSYIYVECLRVNNLDTTRVEWKIYFRIRKVMKSLEECCFGKYWTCSVYVHRFFRQTTTKKKLSVFTYREVNLNLLWKYSHRQCKMLKSRFFSVYEH